MKHTVTIYSYMIDAEAEVEAKRNGISPSGTFEFESDKTGAELWEQVFCLQNAEGNPSGEKALPNVCSMTAGDIMEIDGKWVLCASLGWFEISESEARLWMELPRLERNRWAQQKSETVKAQPV